MPVLTATLVAGSESMVNLGGTILKVGEEAYGYRLVKVDHWEAVFANGDQEIVLPLIRVEER